MNYTLKVFEIRKETADTVTLCFKQPGLKKIKYLAGQYLTLIFRINGRRYIRPYSFSSCPGVDPMLEVTVKRVINGIVSNHINDTVKEGDSIEVMSPLGDFIYDETKGFTSVYLWGVGSGITPLYSIAKHILATAPNVNVYLLYGNRSQESTIFLKQLEVIEKNNPGRLTIKHFHTQPAISSAHPSLIEGRIHKEHVINILNENIDVQQTGHFICGPAGLKESVNDALLSLNISLDNVFSEDFELIKDQKDFEDVFTQVVGINFRGKNFNIEVVKGKTILEAALEADIELPYSCQTGNCSECKGKIVSGKYKMIGVDHVREDLDASEILLCCSHPLTDNVHIEIKTEDI